MDSSSVLIAIVISLVVVSLSIGLYYATTGVLPGSKMIVQEPPIPSNGMEDDQAKFMFFYTTWCNWSKKAQTPWSSLKEMHKNTPRKYGGKTVIFEEINAESDEGKAALYKIKAYPTFKLETKDKVYEMLGKPGTDTFRAFLISALGKESS
jgi:thiol-disulfide isomerase/thioredoxin